MIAPGTQGHGFWADVMGLGLGRHRAACLRTLSAESPGGASSSSSGRRLATAARQLPPFLLELHSLRHPYDARSAAQLSFQAARAASQGQLTPKQAAFLCHLLLEIRWYSRSVCEGLAGAAPSFLEDLSEAEWLLVLRYYVACGWHHKELLEAVALKVQDTAKSLQLHHLEGIASALSVFGHLAKDVGNAILQALTPLPPLSSKGALLRISAALATANVGEPEFYKKVIERAVPAGFGEFDEMLGRASNWRDLAFYDVVEDDWGGTGEHGLEQATLLLLMAKAETDKPKLIHGLLRKTDPLIACAVLPKVQLPSMVGLLHRSSLKFEALLLEARPLAHALAQSVPQVAASLSAEEVVITSRGLGYLGVGSRECFQALRARAEEIEALEPLVDRPCCEALEPRVAAAWAACVAACACSPDHASFLESLRTLEPPIGEVLLRSVDSEVDLVDALPNHVLQEQRQVALCQQALDNASPEGTKRPEWQRVAALLLRKTDPEIIPPRHRPVQETILRRIVRRLRIRGAVCRLSSQSPLDTLILTLPGVAPVRVTIWLKHPALLNLEAHDEPEGVVVNGCATTGFEAIELKVGAASRHLTRFVQKDVTSKELEALADQLFAEAGGSPQPQPRRRARVSKPSAMASAATAASWYGEA